MAATGCQQVRPIQRNYRTFMEFDASYEYGTGRTCIQFNLRRVWQAQTPRRLATSSQIERYCSDKYGQSIYC